MKEGIYYKHNATTQSDGSLEHTVQDQLAIVLQENEDGSRDLVVFPVGGPTLYTRAWEFDPENPYNIVGDSYYREGDVPDFSSLDIGVHPQMAHLKHKHLVEKNTALGGLEELRVKHKQDQDNLRAELALKLDKPEPQPELNPPKGDNPPTIQPKPENGGRRA